MNKNFWKSKNILVTGANGFVGSNLCKRLVLAGANVTGLIRNKNEKTLLFVEGINKKIILINGKLEDKNNLKRILSEQNIEICFHLGAQVEVGIAEQNPYLTWETNIKGTYSLLDSIREQGGRLKAIIVASSDKAYGDYPKNKMPYKENYELKAKYPYDVSKACADMIARSYSSELFNLPIVVTRFANIYGPGQANFSALIPDCIQCSLGLGKFIPRGDGNSERDFLYIDDVINLYFLIAENLYNNPKKIRGEVFNAGSNKPLKVKEVIEKIFKISGKDRDLKKIQNYYKKKKTSGEIYFQSMDYKKVNKYFGWEPKYKFDEGIVETYNWYKKYLNNLK